MGLRAKVHGAAIPTFLGVATNAQGEDVEQTHVRVYARGQEIEGDLPPSVQERFDDGDEHLHSLLEEVDDGGEPSDVYDPSEHSAEDVQKYLETADEEERVRVLDAEEEGKARKTVLEWGGD